MHRNTDELIVTPEMVEETCLDPIRAGTVRINQLINKLDNDITAIRGQIDIAARRFREQGIKSDEDWFRTAQKALRIKQAQHERLTRSLMDARLGERLVPAVSSVAEAYDIRIAFYNAARDILHEEDFREIMDAANASINNRELTATGA
jgi:translation initiation factor 2 alpha subunit (eIF-2alpha)